jgi:anti-sigma regulatory factor (Ser/Thr protein kinase)
MARDILTTVQAVHGLPVSVRAMGVVQLVVSELVTNARKYAPGPCLLDLEIVEGAVQISVWTAAPRCRPSRQPTRKGRAARPGDRCGRVPDVL